MLLPRGGRDREARALSLSRDRFVAAIKRRIRVEPQINPTAFVVTQIDRLMRLDRKSTRLNSSHVSESRMPSSA